jgi:galactokinase/galacturonokinase
MTEASVYLPPDSTLRTLFGERYGSTCGAEAVRAPYRVCPLGAHIDHQGGTVLGLCIDRGVTFLWRPRPDGAVRVTSGDFPGELSFSVRALPRPRGGGFWGDFAVGAVWALREAGHDPTVGLDGVIAGELPVGGLSSSAAVGLAYGIAFRRANGLPLRAWDVIQSAVSAENEYVGVSCGLLDPTTIFFAEEETIVRIRCRDRTVALVEPGRGLPPYTIGVVFSGIERSLARSGYNSRVSECRQAAALLSEACGRKSPARVLGELTQEQYERGRNALPEPLRRRADHYFTESARVGRGLRAWQEGDLSGFGTQMNESGASSIRNYEAGGTEVRALWEIVAAAGGVYGTRFSGGGFGGAVIAFVDPEARRSFEEEVSRRYLERHAQCAAGFRVEFRSSGGGLRWGPVV